MYSKEDVVRLMRRHGFLELADLASRELPDPVDLDQLEAWGLRYGVTTDSVISQLGGSP